MNKGSTPPHVIEFSTSRFEIVRVTDTLVLLRDLPDALASLSANVENCLIALDRWLDDGLGRRRVFFRCVRGRWEQVVHENAAFVEFTAVREQQSAFFDDLIQQAA